MAVPYTFSTATGSLPLSQLDSNFSTAITIGNTAVVLGDTITTINNLTLANVAITSVSTAFPNGYLANSNVIVGTTTLTLGSTVTSINGLSLSNVTISSGNVTISNVTTTNVTATTANVTTTNTSSLVVTGNQTLSGGTANGVAYLNTSKVLTTGSTFVFDGTNVGIGTSLPATILNAYNATSAIISLDGDTTTTFRATRYSTDANLSQFIARKARGTLASPSAVATSDIAGGVFFQAYGGTNFRNIARVDGFVETYTSDTNISGALRFFTNTSTTDVTEKMRIDSSGNVGIGTSSPSTSAILDAQSTTKGVRMPNMTTTQKNAISSPAAGLMVFDTTLSKLCVYSGAAWQTITSV